MQKWVYRLLVIGVIVYGGYRGVAWIEQMDAARTAQQNEVVRHIAEKKGEQVNQALQHGHAIRTDAIRKQLQQAAPAGDSATFTR